ALSSRNVVFRGLVERTGAEIEFLGAHLEGLPAIFDKVWNEARTDLAKLLRGHGYMPLGLPELRAPIASHLERAGLPTKAEQVLVTSGAQQAIALVANLLVEAGDPVVLEDPTYPGAIDAFTLFGARLVGVAHDSGGLPVEALREALSRVSPRVVYLIPTCHNPTGEVLGGAARRQMMHALEGSGAVVLEDMTLAELSLEPRVLPPLRRRRLRARGHRVAPRGRDRPRERELSRRTLGGSHQASLRRRPRDDGGGNPTSRRRVGRVRARAPFPAAGGRRAGVSEWRR